MTKRIALFNHKGGVSKTTTAFNLGWMLAEKGSRVILVDADPQCNLTGMVLGYGGPTALEDFYQQESGRNLRDGLAPAFESRPVPLKGVDCFPVNGPGDLFLLPGHIGISEYEVTLGIAQELSGSIQTLQNLPGSITRLLELTSEKHEADYVLIDLNPSLSSFNQNLLMTSDCFIVPTNPDYFSAMAVQTLARVLPDWRKWAERAAGLRLLKEAVYPFPDMAPKLLGTIVQNYRPRDGRPASAFQAWIDSINSNVSENLFPKLMKEGMTLPEPVYKKHGVEGLCLATIPDFNSLIAKSQDHQTPVYALTSEQLGQAGNVLASSERSRDNFREIFSDLADKVVALVNDASNP
jgi:cellulose biosynthesis protein BcsQ